MIKITARKSTDIEGIIKKCYPTDQELIEKYHVLAPTTIEDAEKHTIAALKRSIDAGILTVYELSKNGYFVGYFGKEVVAGMDYLTGFFLLPEYRDSENVVRFWRIVKAKFDKTIFTYLYEKNTRAIKFIQKKGFKLNDRVFIPQEKQFAKIFKYN